MLTTRNFVAFFQGQLYWQKWVFTTTPREIRDMIGLVSQSLLVAGFSKITAAPTAIASRASLAEIKTSLLPFWIRS